MQNRIAVEWHGDSFIIYVFENFVASALARETKSEFF